MPKNLGILRKTSNHGRVQPTPAPAQGMQRQETEIQMEFLYLHRRYLSGMKREEWVAPMPGRPCFTGL